MALSGEKNAIMPEDQYVKSEKQMVMMPRDQVIRKRGELVKMCICPQCPTYNDCAKKAMEFLFCYLGHSFHCIENDKGCICSNCPVAKMQGLQKHDFCLKGSEKSQRFDAMLK